MRWIVLGLGLSVLVACQPSADKVDWTIQHLGGQGQLTVQMPGATRVEVSPVFLGGAMHEVTLLMAEENNQFYTVACVSLEAHDAHASAYWPPLNLEAQFKQGLLEPLLQGFGHAWIDAMAKPSDQTHTLRSKVTGVTMTMVVRLVQIQGVMLRLVAIGPTDAFSDSVAQTFIQSPAREPQDLINPDAKLVQCMPDDHTH